MDIGYIKKVPNKIQEKVFLRGKRIRQAFMPPVEEKRILFIIGCQRSGTTMMQKIFEKDLHARVFGEFSTLSNWDPGKIRLNPLNQVKREIESKNVPLIVLKPLVEIHNIHSLLKEFPNSKAVWMYRHYKDVAASNLVNFGEKNGINDLRPIVKGEPLNWRSEGASKEVRAVVSKYFSESMSEHDAAAIFWYARNSLYFELNMAENSRIKIYRYRDFVQQPAEKVSELYDFMGLSYPGDKLVNAVKTNSVGKGKDIKLDPEIEVLCEEMQQRLDEVYLAEQAG